ncbi:MULTISPECIES: nitroreductase family protein [Bacillota]|mgnify:CR=1 FL=1|jgi:nitroreductase|uniref:Nitroreductase n=2 Tax=Amedibacillus TaxID=2749846 RepID=A0A7G9GKS6_9FIRM|nr:MULTISPECIES: nitroreductase [Bacillota]QNM11408.1 nitroreductase [[Eubacterium] hominis]MCH4284578.1 nitroreductase [Amedibacillus hominis]RGB54746.1 diguanylate cyclase [Absiella sp. AM22-9]RGB60376.1 diguanylate cyclase [Absiella sp. AM10-20]RGB65239.1 diguanylate cyclase [Absiella sp. AM09-45]
MSNELLELLKSRRSIRSYLPKMIKEEELDAIVEAGTYAPTAMGRQSPIIVAVTNKEIRDELSRMNAEIMQSVMDPYYGAPVIILVFAPREEATHIQDASCVLLNMMLAAHSLHIGTCWINREKEMFNTPRGKQLMAEWKIDGCYEGVGALAVGYSREKDPCPKKRKSDYIIKVK